MRVGAECLVRAAPAAVAITAVGVQYRLKVTPLDDPRERERRRREWAKEEAEDEVAAGIRQNSVGSPHAGGGDPADAEGVGRGKDAGAGLDTTPHRDAAIPAAGGSDDDGGESISEADEDAAIELAERRRAARDEVFGIAARWIVRVAEINGGAYVKLGQLIASGKPALPESLTKPCEALQDAVAPTAFPRVRAMIEDELGAPIEDIFESFDEDPIACASIAQVHRATLRPSTRRGQHGQSAAVPSDHEPREVAVKVQHPRLREKARADAAAIEALSRLAGWVAPGFEFSWIAPELTAALDMETDFVQEARHAAEARRILAGAPRWRRDSPRWIVPEVVERVSTSRVMCAAFVRGCRIDDPRGIRARGSDPLAVAENVVRGFAHMLFHEGFVHADPHPGNLIFTDAGEIALLDHGLWRRFDPAFRLSLCRLWRGMILLDPDEVDREARSMGAGEIADILSVLLTYRSPRVTLAPGAPSRPSPSPAPQQKESSSSSSSSSQQKESSSSSQQRSSSLLVRPPGRGPTPEERRAMRARIRALGLHRWSGADVMRALEGLPRDLLYLFKVNGLVRGINFSLGGDATSRLRAFGQAAIEGIHRRNTAAARTSRGTREDDAPSGEDEQGRDLDFVGTGSVRGAYAGVPLPRDVGFLPVWRDRWLIAWRLTLVEYVWWALGWVRWARSGPALEEANRDDDKRKWGKG